MKKPTLKVSIPFKYDYEEHDEEVVIYKATYYHSDDYEDPEENPGECEYCRDEDCDGGCEESRSPPIDEMNLQKILDLLPNNIKPKDVKINLDIRQSSHGASSSDKSFVCFYYLEKMPNRLEQYKIDSIEYEEAYSKYQAELKLYNVYQAQQEIDKLEKKLKELKKEV